MQMCHLEAVIAIKEIPIPSYPIICCTKKTAFDYTYAIQTP